MQDLTRLYPLLFQPIYKEKIWGGRALEQLGRALPGDANTRIGESWEIADLATTSKSGGGGNSEHSVVANGQLAGKTIRELMETYGEALLGPGVQPADDGGFPLLIKFLDARENLSVQVHPSPAYAAAHPDAHLKSEAWYVVDAEPGAVIYKGLRPGVTPEMLRAALEINTDDAVVPLLNAIAVKPGDCHYLPSGTLHALGAGVLVAEVQTPSDTTFRVYDWGRSDRELHIKQAMACIDFSDANPGVQQIGEPWVIGNLTVIQKATCEYFRISESSFDRGCFQRGCHSDCAEVFIPLEGEASLFNTKTESSVPLSNGQAILMLPTAQSYLFTCKQGGRWLRVSLPAQTDNHV